MDENEFHQEILQRLDILICLLLDKPATEKPTSIASKVHKLSDLGLSPSEIAKILGVTEAAVSQYFNHKRADIPLDASTKTLIAKASKNIKDQAQFVYHSQSILNHMLKTKQTCHIHATVNKDVAHDCNTCFECT